MPIYNLNPSGGNRARYGVDIGSSGELAWSGDPNPFEPKDVAIKRISAGTLKITDGSTGYGDLQVRSISANGVVTTSNGQLPSFTEVNRLEKRWRFRGVALGGGAGEPEAFYDSTAGLVRMYVAYTDGTIHRATASNPLGPFTDHGAILGNGTGVGPSLAGRTSLFVDGTNVYIFFSDEAVSPSGNIHYAKSTDSGVTFTYQSLKLAHDAVPGSDGWNSIHFYDDETTIHILVEGDADTGAGNRWRMWYFTADSGDIEGDWTLQNDGNYVSSLNFSGDDASDEHSSPGPIFKIGEFFHCLPHLSGYIHGPGGDNGSEIYHTKSIDFLHWTKPRLMIDRSRVPLIDDDPTTQLADGTLVVKDGVLYYYCTQVKVADGFGARVVVFSYEGELEDLFGGDDCDRMAGELLPDDIATDRDVHQFNGTTRKWELRDAYAATERPAPTGGYVTITSGGTPSPDFRTVTIGAPTWLAYYEQFSVPGQCSVLWNNTDQLWEVRDSENNKKWSGTGTSPTNPAGTYTDTFNSATGSLTIAFTPAVASAVGVYYGDGRPNFTAPRGSTFRRTRNHNSDSSPWNWINDTSTAEWSPILSPTFRRRFQVTKAVDQEIVSGDWRKITWPTVVKNPGGQFANDRWTPGVVGCSRLNLTVNLTPSATAGLVQLAFRKNGAFDSTTRIIAGLEAGTAGFVLSGSAQFDHDADDYFEAWIFCQYNSLHFTAAAYCNFFDGEVLSLGD